MAKQLSVGDTFTHVRECDKYRPIYYAAASGDFNPIHIDPDAGKAAGLGGPILQGLCLTGGRDRWLESAEGLSPLDTATQVAVP